jgi:hypothetical protein
MAEVKRIFRKEDGSLLTSDDDPGETAPVPRNGVFVYALVLKGEKEHIVKVPVPRPLLADDPARAESALVRFAEHY